MMKFKLLLFAFALMTFNAFSQSNADNSTYGLRHFQLGKNLSDVWVFVDAEAKKNGYAGANPWNEVCSQTTENFGPQHKVFSCYDSEFRIRREKFTLGLIVDNGKIIKITLPQENTPQLMYTVHKNFVEEMLENLEKKYSQSPAISSVPIKLSDDFNDEFSEYYINCGNVMRAAIRGENSTYNQRDVCTLNFQSNGVVNINQFPGLLQSRDELIYKIKAAAAKKGKDCQNCNAKLYTAQWGTSGSDNVMRMRYTQRDLTGAYKFLSLEIVNEMAIDNLLKINKSIINSAESQNLRR